MADYTSSNSEMLYNYASHLVGIRRMMSQFDDDMNDDLIVENYEESLRRFWKTFNSKRIRKDPYANGLEWAFYHAIEDSNAPLYYLWEEYTKKTKLSSAAKSLLKYDNMSISEHTKKSMREEFFSWISRNQTSSEYFIIPHIPYSPIKYSGDDDDNGGEGGNFKVVLEQFFLVDGSESSEVYFDAGDDIIERTRKLLTYYKESLERSKNLLQFIDEDVHWGTPIPLENRYQVSLKNVLLDMKRERMIKIKRKKEDAFVLSTMRELNNEIARMVEEKRKLSKSINGYEGALRNRKVEHIMNIRILVMGLTPDDYDGFRMDHYMKNMVNRYSSGQILVSSLKGKARKLANKLQNIGNIILFAQRESDGAVIRGRSIRYYNANSFEGKPIKYSLWMLFQDTLTSEYPDQ